MLRRFRGLRLMISLAIATVVVLSLWSVMIGSIPSGDRPLDLSQAVSIDDPQFDPPTDSSPSPPLPENTLLPLQRSDGAPYERLFAQVRQVHQQCLFTPPWYSVPIDRTNFGDRYRTDIRGQVVDNAPLIVLHETVASAQSTLDFFQTPHPRDEDQASYHELITLRGWLLHLVPWSKRAYGAGNSVFGRETVQTNLRLAPSVNNFALHFSLETPPEGRHNGSTHAGYTDAQYRTLAWLVAQTGIDLQRVTTHAAVDRSGERMDPRSFDWATFNRYWQAYRDRPCGDIRG
ncbi:peptidoglycan recognition family protein [Thermosynechococcus sp. PP45]|uniref:peptidoglycan recognition protein family protein n=1 Tax=unclassified Thermosynechococcus TaxID=2622553 RepID=UPI0026710706|nr:MULTISPECIES: peptidoglycan recognition family protein [unclassified Thermosynechococcus]WKT81282.1 peptidoglycan recognition family protein [Thermosynechococcus sp. PP45]WNC22338.1 peptidoglycan recognition family protein [Thermosynechococcus sp. PP22]WNC24894.1 peptidoglycan recognition family protein [Thermosynechococcus sp. PP551]WNC27471.1 peptidoglycan recognition family protein [Thermosynechococcus sp. PP555]WNC60429.1 peptidoglycan recognition family protein [Thermosynechococcus sp.